MASWWWRLGLAAVGAVLPAAPVAAGTEPAFVQFESGPVSPVALSEDGETLVVTNLPDGQLEVFDATADGLRWRWSVPVGLDPVAVAFRSPTEAWVVNHVSDSVSVVDLERGTVVATLLVGDEPRDIVFAGDRAFVSTAHRGQRRSDPLLADVPGAGDPRLTTPGVGRADVWVFEGSQARQDGLPIEIVTVFGDTPRGLAVSPDDATVYVAVLHSGNGTTTISEPLVCDGFEAAGPCEVEGTPIPGGNPGPSTNAAGSPAPEVGLIVQHDGAGAWLDEQGRDWSAAVRFDLPDYDVFSIDAHSLEPAAPPVRGAGTTLFNLAVDPTSGRVFVSNTEANNPVRFEGPGQWGGSTVRGDLARARISTFEPGADRATPVHLNPNLADDGGADAARSLATPLDVAVSDDGGTLYVAAYGSSRVGVRSTSRLIAGQGAGDDARPDIVTTGGGPAGLALDEARGRLYVYTRFDNAIAVHDLHDGAELDKHAMPTPEPVEVVEGRPLLYDAERTSQNGEASCAACHVFGDMDHLAWDLGNPDADVTTGEIPIRMEPGTGTPINGTGNTHDFHPMKGPMTTQTLRGLRYAGAQHWRGDRSVGSAGSDPYDAVVSFLNFNDAFVGLVGRDEPLPADEMELFAEFAMSIALPPNPVRNLDGSLTDAQQRALSFFTSEDRIAVGVHVPNFGFSCEGCHTLDPAAGAFGTGGEQGFSNQTQIFKIPHLRNLYQKVGMFGMAAVPTIGGDGHEHQGPAMRGFGFGHDGSIDTLERFFHGTQFDATGPDVGFASDDERRDMVELMLAFDTDLAPIVGQQVTVHGALGPAAEARLALLLEAAGRPYPSALVGGDAPACELVAKARVGERVMGWVLRDARFVPDDETEPWSVEALLELAVDTPVTLTAVVPGTGERLGIDRDADGSPDGVDECPRHPDPGWCEDQPGLPPRAGDDESETGDETGDPRAMPGGSGCACRAGASGRAVPWLLLVLASIRIRRRGYGRT